MYKCDKCGCEHSSRTVCPKCGAPVVIVNQDYLLRRQQWEEQQRNHLRYKKKDEDKKKVTEPSESSGTFKDSIISKLRSIRADKDEERKKREKEKNADELKDRHRENRIKLVRRRMAAAVAAAAGIIVIVVAAVVGSRIYRGIDRSDVRYFDGHELVSVKDGVLLDVDREGGDYALLAYTEELNAMLFRNGDSLLGWYGGNEYTLISDMGDITDEYLFSESGRYLAYVMYSEAEALYSLVIYDLSEGSSSVYSGGKRIKLVAVTADGAVLYDELETTGYSTVVSMSVYAADITKKLLVADNVTDVFYDAENDDAAFIKDECLYTCSISECIDKYEGIISDREHIFVNEGVLSIADNLLDKAVLYITDDGLWIYEDGVSRFAAVDVDSSAVIYYDGTDRLYYRAMDRLYYVEQDSKTAQKTDSKQEYLEAGSISGSGDAELILDGLEGDIAVSAEGNIFCLDSEGNLYGSNEASERNNGKGGLNLLESGVAACGTLYGEDGCVFVKAGELICCYGKVGKQRVVLGKSDKKAAFSDRAVSSGKYLYYVDSSSVLWKIAKKGSSRESLGYVSLIGLYK